MKRLGLGLFLTVLPLLGILCVNSWLLSQDPTPEPSPVPTDVGSGRHIELTVAQFQKVTEGVGTVNEEARRLALQFLEGHLRFMEGKAKEAKDEWEALVNSSDRELRYNASTNPDITQYYTGVTGTRYDDPSTPDVNEGFTPANSRIRTIHIQRAASDYGNWYLGVRSVSNALEHVKEM